MNITERYRFTTTEPLARDGDIYIGLIIKTQGAIELRAEVAIVKSGDHPGDWLSISTLERVEPIKYKCIRGLKSKRALTCQDWNIVQKWMQKNEKANV